MGYRSVVVVGHSAGGIVARHFVEDDPDAGVTKVIQVSAPNGGSPWATWQIIQPKEADFLESLTKPVRRLAVAGRSDRRIPMHIEFACIVANGLVFGDGLVGTGSQWTADLQQQGIPVFALPTTHWQTVRIRSGAELIADLVRSPLPRWDAAHVAAAPVDPGGRAAHHAQKLNKSRVATMGGIGEVVSVSFPVPETTASPSWPSAGR